MWCNLVGHSSNDASCKKKLSGYVMARMVPCGLGVRRLLSWLCPVCLSTIQVLFFFLSSGVFPLHMLHLENTSTFNFMICLCNIMLQICSLCCMGVVTLLFNIQTCLTIFAFGGAFLIY